MDAQELINSNLIVRMLAGSHAYGMSTPESDVDYRGIFYAPEVSIRTPFFPIKEVTDSSEEDTKYHELTHFMKLVLNCNPNIIELLWTDDSAIEHRTPAYEHLRAHREQLLSKKAAFTFTGYAFAQLKRIKGHNKWINRPQSETPPRQIDYISMVQNFTEEKLFKLDFENYREGWVLLPFGGEIYGVYPHEGYTTYNADFTLNPFKPEDNENNPFTADESGHFRKSPSFLVKYNKEQYNADKDTWKNYWNWKRNRNEKRSTLEEQFGYDTKHAAHLVRLLRMGNEILETGQVHVLRPDAQELLDIRKGKWTYEYLVEYAESLDKNIREVLYKTSPLRHSPDFNFAAQLLMDVQDICWAKQ